MCQRVLQWCACWEVRKHTMSHKIYKTLRICLKQHVSEFILLTSQQPFFPLWKLKKPIPYIIAFCFSLLTEFGWMTSIGGFKVFSLHVCSLLNPDSQSNILELECGLCADLNVCSDGQLDFLRFKPLPLIC